MTQKAPKFERWYPLDLPRRKQGQTFFRSAMKPPKSAQWGWSDTPLSTRVLIVGAFFNLVCLATPFWAYASDLDNRAFSTFGLWHYCGQIGETCDSIHDNLIEGRSVPAWYFMAQGTYTIGTVGTLITLAILTSYAEGITLKMTDITHNAVILILGIGILQQFVGLYTFVKFFEETDFLYEKENTADVDFYGSFYCGIIGLACCVISELLLLASDEIILPKREADIEYERLRQLHAMKPSVYKVHVT